MLNEIPQRAEYMQRFQLLKAGISLAIVPFFAWLLGGCSTTIFNTKDLAGGKAHLVSLDAKQRVVLVNQVKKTTGSPGGPQIGTNQSSGAASASTDQIARAEDVVLRFCAEPPPDVFTALAASFGGEISGSQSASLDLAAAAKIAASLSENAATIERTQTINVLREVMYRNCERYLSGAIDGDEFIVQSARDQQLIVQVLAVEQISGVARAQSTALTTISKAAASGVTDIGLGTLADAKKDRDAKRTASENSASDASALPPAGACAQNSIDTANLPDGVTADQAKAKNAKCDEVKTAASRLKEAEEYLAVVQQAVARQADVSSETQGKLASATQTVSQASRDIADAVLKIVERYHFDEIVMTCVVRIRKSNGRPDDYCEDLLTEVARTRQAQAQLTELQASQDVLKLRAEMEQKTNKLAAEVWNKLSSASPRADGLKQLEHEAGIALKESHRQKLLKSANLFEFSKAFGKLLQAHQEALGEAARKQ